jgi:hypothetical protein
MSMKKCFDIFVPLIQYYLSRETVTLMGRSHVEEPEVSQRTEHQRKALYSGTIFHTENVKKVKPEWRIPFLAAFLYKLIGLSKANPQT